MLESQTDLQAGSASARNRFAGPCWPEELRQQPDTASAGELVEREGYPRDFQQGELQFESNGSLFGITRCSEFGAGQMPVIQ